MAKCGSCGGGARNVTPVAPSNEQSVSGDMVLLEYVGAAEQKQRVRSRIVPREQYVFSGRQRKFRVYRGDVNWLTAMADFRVARVEQAPAQAIFAEQPALTSEMRPPADLPLEALGLDAVLTALLKRKFNTVNEVKRAGRAEWLTIKGMGDRRATIVQEALDALQK